MPVWLKRLAQRASVVPLAAVCRRPAVAAAAAAGFATALGTSALPQAHSADIVHASSLPLTRTCFADAAAKAAPAVVNLQCQQPGMLSDSVSTGSGFIVDESGLLLTNYHVVKGCSQVTVTFWDGRTRVRGRVHSADARSDIALVQIIDRPPRSIATAAHKFPVIKRGVSHDLRAGEFVLALGSPLGLRSTVSAGIVSSPARAASEIGIMTNRMYYIQTDAAINPGNSGGPLVNLDGEVIGMNTIKLGGDKVDAIGFAIPMDSAWPVVSQLLKNKHVQRPVLGFTMVTTRRSNVMVTAVQPGSPAEKAGMRVGDRIVSCDDVPVKRIRDVLNRMGISPGQRIVFEVEGSASAGGPPPSGGGTGGGIVRKLELVSERAL